jgi:hypothetical protein
VIKKEDKNCQRKKSGVLQAEQRVC